PSALPTFLLSEMTRQHVTVALSGDGGDELFAGYNRYFHAETMLRALSHVPRGARSLAAAGIRALSPASWSSLAALVPAAYRPPQLGDKLHKVAGLLEEEDAAGGFYRRIVSQWPEPESVVRGGREPRALLDDPRLASLVPDMVER